MTEGDEVKKEMPRSPIPPGTVGDAVSPSARATGAGVVVNDATGGRLTGADVSPSKPAASAGARVSVAIDG